ncbi:glycosyltransferase family 2 protein [Mycoplasma sp. ES3157-GEN-MYC]|uniref:Glycosyltransferase family 2 protein n=1 Tax=Mycoplasma miroungigenitalium TaxID=754515 RepID=A0A6M4J898_9MOLU|nr:glycosyltransferase family A protein [Mycoplasma miroungigenitalium]MBU4690097.1 glycosyltransferase family 2 protein [Mycoplasma miroungigenitalium]MBU4691368.1 glycosyltransferase family 2 protein [Mycoplasma miroungigenitalium]QJR43204.1 glycosyltransferase family 2 protein [Mycoplasma miroungigenitalium]
MKLSIITPAINDWKELDYLLQTLKLQDNQDFETICVITKPSKKMYQILENALQFFGSRFKFIVNMKRKSIQSDIVAALHLVKNNYVYILNADAMIKKNFVRTVTNKLNDVQPDIIEFKPVLTGSIKWKPMPRLESDVLMNISSNPKFVAYAFPFIFNKIFKKSFIEQFARYRVKELNDTKFATELLYFMLVNATTYQFWNIQLVKENISSATWFTPRNFVAQFRIIENYLETTNTKLTQELAYAQLYFLQIVLAGFLDSWEFSVFKVLQYIFESRSDFSEKRADKYLEDLQKYLTKYHNENQQVFLTNIYLNTQNPESTYLKKLPEFRKTEPIYKSL